MTARKAAVESLIAGADRRADAVAGAGEGHQRAVIAGAARLGAGPNRERVGNERVGRAVERQHWWRAGSGSAYRGQLDYRFIVEIVDAID